MNTPAHAVVNLALLETRWPRCTWPILAGAVVPDLPMFVFYGWEKLVLDLKEPQIWRTDYFVSSWQPVIDALHSFPLIALALTVALRLRLPRATAFSASLLVHAVCDFFLHNEDAHRQLFPLSDYRFRGPISYWDPAHHGTLGSALEVAAVVVASIALARRHRSIGVRLTLAATALLFVAGWIAFYALR